MSNDTRRRRRLPLWVLAGLAFTVGTEVRAGDALIAVATNFGNVMPLLESAFEQETEHELRFTTGSTGQMYAQIRQHAPFDVFLAADQGRARRLVEEGLAVAGSRFTYARGRLVLWSKDSDRIGADGAATLRESPPRVLALANPALAPYGVAGRQTLEALGLWSRLEPRIALGQNVGQAYAMTATGAADMGFVP
ncbi:MAG: molybdate ABC transporter substrate-binding protein, partial [Halofilum sp. (in: g-proteobacteria)]|nr:molybdate ABC transporter substrate-binding protein [Halofilum sp. (in: g-proteobacteria)]